ncbi:MAG: hypothetical protein KDA99_14655 [Planctomycetales bacterium]|nr:hypothetical protein [Planctomycetales bacterium]
MIIQRMTLQQVVQAAGAGAKVVLPALAILWLASSMSRMTGSKSYEDQKPSQPYEFASHRLYTGEYLQAKITGQMPGTASSDATEDHAKARAETLRKLLPTIVFVLSGFVAFCTGTSWGTMGILLPMTVNSTYTVLSITQGVVAPSDPILLCTIGGVLAGAVFGDHCSPISDTTVLSSQASGCDHIAHVITQLPYAMAVAAIAVVLGTLPIGWGVSVWVAGPLQVVTLWVLLRMVGGKVQQETLDANNHP